MADVKEVMKNFSKFDPNLKPVQVHNDGDFVEMNGIVDIKVGDNKLELVVGHFDRNTHEDGAQIFSSFNAEDVGEDDTLSDTRGIKFAEKHKEFFPNGWEQKDDGEEEDEDNDTVWNIISINHALWAHDSIDEVYHTKKLLTCGEVVKMLTKALLNNAEAENFKVYIGKLEFHNKMSVETSIDARELDLVTGNSKLVALVNKEFATKKYVSIM